MSKFPKYFYDGARVMYCIPSETGPGHSIIHVNTLQMRRGVAEWRLREMKDVVPHAAEIDRETALRIVGKDHEDLLLPETTATEEAARLRELVAKLIVQRDEARCMLEALVKLHSDTTEQRAALRAIREWNENDGAAEPPAHNFERTLTHMNARLLVKKLEKTI